MTEWRTTRSGYRFQVIKVDDLVREAGEPFTWTCTVKGCGLVIQGGPRALSKHQQTVHADQAPRLN